MKKYFFWIMVTVLVLFAAAPVFAANKICMDHCQQDFTQQLGQCRSFPPSSHLTLTCTKEAQTTKAGCQKNCAF